MSSAIGGSCPNNVSVCFPPLLVAHVLIMNQYAFPAIGGSCPNNVSVCFPPLLVAHVLIMYQYVFPKNGPLDNLLLSFCQRRLLSPFLHSMRMTNTPD